MATKTNIVNLALARIGSTIVLTDVDTDTSQEAIVARILYDDERLFALRDFNWPFARKYTAMLALFAGSEAVPVNADWIYAYVYPSDCVFARRILGCAGQYDPAPPPFVIGRQDSGDAIQRVIYTNQEHAGLEYTVNVTDAREFEPSFASMLAWRLAANLALALSRLPDLAKSCLEMYAAERGQTITRAVAEGEYDVSSGEADPRVRDIFNLALTRLGVTRNGAAADPELSFAVLWPRLNFADERDFVLRDFPWPWATQYGKPDLVTGSSTEPANADWVFAYKYPTDALFVRRIVRPGSIVDPLSGMSTPRGFMGGRYDPCPAPFRIGSGIVNPDAEPADRVRGRLIFTNEPDATIEYTLQITDPNEFDAAFVSMLAWRIAATLAPGMASVKKDPKVVDRANQAYELEKSRAMRAALNEGQVDMPLDADWIRNR